MLGHLTESELEFYNNILIARALGRGLNEQEKLADRLLGFDWSYRESDAPGTYAAAEKAEEELIADIDASGLDDAQKMEWLKLFSAPYAVVIDTLKKWRWVQCMRYVDSDPERSKVTLALNGVKGEHYEANLALQAKFRRFSDIISAAKCTERLIMTDDCINFTVLRERAMEELKKDKENFFFGVTVPQEAQDIIDDIVRNDKQLFINMVESGCAKVMFPSFQVDSNNPDGTWLVTMQCTGDYRDAFGFFFSKRPTRPRRDWAPKLQTTKPAPNKFDARDDARYVEPAPMVERRSPANANIPAIPERRVKTPMALSNRPMAVAAEKPKPKKVKTAPKARAKKFAVLGDATQLGELLSSRSN
jgi:hypothetical protein